MKMCMLMTVTRGHSSLVDQLLVMNPPPVCTLQASEDQLTTENTSLVQEKKEMQALLEKTTSSMQELEAQVRAEVCPWKVSMSLLITWVCLLQLEVLKTEKSKYQEDLCSEAQRTKSLSQEM